MTTSTRPRVLPIAAGVAAVLGLFAAAAPSAAVDELTAFDVTDDLPFARNVTVGPDGSVWVRGETPTLGRIDPDTGAVDPLCDLGAFTDITSNYELEVDPDGRIWLPWTPDVSDVPAGLRVVRVDPSDCDTSDFELTGAQFGAAAIDALADGTVWVSTFGELVQLDGDAGTVLDSVEGAFPYFDTMVVVGGRAFGARSSDGTIWVVDLGTGSATELSPTDVERVQEIVLGPDGRVWFAGDGGDEVRVGSLAADGTGLTSSSLGEPGSASGAAFGPDGNLWVGNAVPFRLLVVDPATSSVLRELDLVEPGYRPGFLAASDDAVWVAAPIQSAVLRVQVVEPTQPTPTTVPAQPTDTTVPVEPPAAAPVAAEPSFTG